MKKILRLFGLFILNSKLNIAKQMEYRFNFFLTSIIALVFSSISPLLQYLIFKQTKRVSGVEPGPDNTVPGSPADRPGLAKSAFWRAQILSG